MSRIVRVLLAMTAIVILVAAVMAFFGARLVRKSLPQVQGEARLTGLRQGVTVHRDGYSVPHVYARDEADLWRAAGYVAAQDRLWQMDFMRRAACGTLSEIIGAETVAQDKFLRVWGFHRLARNVVPTLSSTTRAALEAYAAGVNAFIQTHSDRLPVEFNILAYKPQPWEIEDSIALVRLMGFRLCHSWFYEAALGRVAAQFGVPMALELFPAVRETTPVIVPTPLAADRMWDGLLQVAQRTRLQLGMPPGVLGSNGWVVSGARSRSGKPLLANDPHLGLTLPSIWYEMHLAAGDFEVAGVTLAGVPGVIIGRNRAIAWGCTNGMVDDLDFYWERLHPENPNLYWDGQDWQKMTVLSEPIKVKGGESVPFEVRLTRRGPVVNDVLQVVRHDSLAVSFRWTGFEASDEVYAFLTLNRATNWQQFQQAMRSFVVPCQNVVYADTGGNIGYWASGVVPIRRDGRGYLPYRGWENEGDWVGIIPFESMPHVFNPPQQFVATANNRMIGGTYPYYLGNGWAPTSRIERITELLNSPSPMDTATFKQMQADQVSRHALFVLPRLLRLLQDHAAGGAPDTAFTVQENHARRLLMQWDGQETEESVAATIFNVWARTFLSATLKDEMGDTLFESYTQWSALAVRALEHLVDHPQSPWFDDRTTAETENGQYIARHSFAQALSHLQQTFGELIGDWQWGKLHRLTMQHPLGRVKPLEVVFNVGPLALGGSTNTINMAEFRLHRPYEVVAGPSLRMIVDLAAPQTSLQIIAGGQSGQPFSPHYRDQVALWHKVRYRQLTMAAATSPATSAAVLQLNP